MSYDTKLQNTAQTTNRSDCSGGRREESGDTFVRSRWPHGLAVLLLVATWLLICVGGIVTTTGAGMAFEDWPTSDGENMLLYPWFQATKDKFIEHGHRLFGAAVGLIAIGLCIVVWLKDQRRWVGWLSIGALLLVIGQGILGGLRVLLGNVQIAKIHGCVAPLFFALVVAITVFTSRWWSERKVIHCGASGRLRRLAVLTFFLAYVQLVLGALLRHVSPSAPGSTFRTAIFFHLILAAVLLIDGIALCWQSQRHFKGDRQLLGPPRVLLVLLVIQLLLGAGAWVLKYSWPAGLFAETPGFAGWTNTAGGLLQASVVTGHVATGSLILGASLWTALRFFRGTTGRPAGVSTPAAHYSAMGVL